MFVGRACSDQPEDNLPDKAPLPNSTTHPRQLFLSMLFPNHFTSDSALIQMSYSARVPGVSFRLSSQPGAGAEAGTRSPMPLPPHRSPQPPHPARTQPFVPLRHTPGPPHPGGDAGSPPCTHPSGCSPVRLRQVWAPGGRARLPCLLGSATKCEPAGQRRL